MKIKVLLVSRNAWDDTQGNTWSNFFQDFEKEELAQIYCRDEIPFNTLCTRYFRISESQLVKSLFKKHAFAGEIVDITTINKDRNAKVLEKNEKKLYDFFRNNRFVLFLWLREILWLLGKWKSPQLRKFISDFKPDVIYSDAYDTFYTYSVLNFVQSVANVPVVLFHCDDQVTFQQFSLSPLYWLNRLMLRKNVSKAINMAAINYAIIDGQKEAYEKIYQKEFKILNKGATFANEFVSSAINKPIRMVFAGNLYHGRWKTLSKLSEAIKRINSNEIKVILDIYTGNTVPSKIRNALNVPDAVMVRGYLPYNELIEIQKKSDILLHVESFQLKEKLITHLSFSTKIVDFFEMGKCIVAIGWEESAPIKYLIDKDAAIIVTDLNELENALSHLIDQKEMITHYGEKAYQCGKKYHDKAKVIASFRYDLIEIKNKIPN